MKRHSNPLRSECVCRCHEDRRIMHMSACCRYESPEVVNDKHFLWQLEAIRRWK